MDKPNIFIRGMYSTALTKLFIDAGYPIIFPSTEIQERFKIPFRPSDSYSKDVTIRDRLDQKGISIMFKKKVWEQLEKDEFQDFPLLQKNFPELIVFVARFQKNSIYRGLVIESNRERRFSYVRLTPEEIGKDGVEEADKFQTTVGRYARYMEEGKEGVFQVTHEDNGKN